MTSPRVDLLVLDAHGVVLNAYWPHFLGEIARCIGEPEHELTRRWHDTLREDAWCGRIDDEELWNRLTRARMNDAECRALLEAGYTLGPLAVHLNAWATRVPVWLLSNHRSHWLRPRLQRFGIYHLFQRVLVMQLPSDLAG